MIFIHKFKIANGHKKTEVTKVYTDREKAVGQQAVLGGEIEEFMPITDEKVEMILTEVASIIDDMSTESPGSPRHFEPNSEEWLIYKTAALANILAILRK